METLFSIDNIFTLGMLILLQAVLGFDNLLYISIESRRVQEDRQAYVRRVGIALAIILRIVLLIVLLSLIQYFKEPFYSFDLYGAVSGSLTIHSLIVLFGGVFIIYTAVKEIFHLLTIEKLEGANTELNRSVPSAIFWIVLMNLIFSFDSILSAIALTEVIWVMTVAIIVTGALMIWLADRVASFLEENRMYEVLGLFILFIVGILLLSDGGHLSHLKLFGFAVEPMAKSTFYFSLFVLITIQIIQSQYRKKLLAQRKAEMNS